MCQPEVSDLLQIVYWKFQITIWNHMEKGPFCCRAIVLEFPAVDIRSQKSLATFKEKLKTFLFIKSFS